MQVSKEFDLLGLTLSISQLNKVYGNGDQLKFIEGEAGIPFIAIHNKSAQALISLFGGQVLSYLPVGEDQDLLFRSTKAIYNREKAIRAGIPICWPWFGQDIEGLSSRSHGFARNFFWTVASTDTSADWATKVTLLLVQSPEKIKIWPHQFDLKLEITVANKLTLELISSNTGDKPFFITQALHAYFQIGDINHIQVTGLEDAQYLDKLDDGLQKKQSGAVSITGEVDRIYTGAQTPLIIEDLIINRRIQISFTGGNTAIVWNPWQKKSAQMTDLDTNDYKRFLCVETGNAATDGVTVSPGSEHSLISNFEILANV